MKTIKKLLLMSIVCCTTTSFAQTAKIVNELEKVDKVTGTTVYNDSKDALKTVYTDVKSMGPKVEESIKELAKTFKTTADKLWDILVRQQMVNSIVYLILTITSLICWFIFYRNNYGNNIKYEKIMVTKDKMLYPEGTLDKDKDMYSAYSKKVKHVEEEELKAVPNSTISWFKYVHMLICLTLSFFSFYHFQDMLTGFLNPEYGALQNIVNVATQLR